jgi:pimeloyl-ACP methyl ester carboxylesterase
MALAHNGDCTIYFDTFGDTADPTLLLVNGLGSQCVNYHEDWCAMFVARGFHVVRYDNRDVGLSTKYDDAPMDKNGAAYTLSDMAADGIAVLDALSIKQAHVMGLSMGGMIVQTMAIEHPERLLSVTSVMSHPGEPGYGRATKEAQAALLGPSPTDLESATADWIAGQRIWGSPAFADEDRWRAAAKRSFDRCFNPSGTTRQYRAIVASPPRFEQLREVNTPTLVLHGDCDTLIDASGGRRTAELIPDARFELIEGMGHDYPPQLWQRWTGLVADFALG